MFYIYSKEKLPKLIFDINLTSDEINAIGWDTIFSYYPNIKKENSIIIERNVPFTYPILDNNDIREMSREEMIEEGVEISLTQGEYIENKKLITVPQPSSYHTWNAEAHTWDINMEETKKIFRQKFQKVLTDTLFGSYEYKIKLSK